MKRALKTADKFQTDNLPVWKDSWVLSPIEYDHLKLPFSSVYRSKHVVYEIKGCHRHDSTRNKPRKEH